MKAKFGVAFRSGSCGFLSIPGRLLASQQHLDALEEYPFCGQQPYSRSREPHVVARSACIQLICLEPRMERCWGLPPAGAAHGRPG